MSALVQTEPFRITEEHIVPLGNSAATDEQRRRQESLRQLQSEITLEYHVQLATLDEAMEWLRENGGPTPEQLEDMRQRQENIELDYDAWRAEFGVLQVEINLPTAGGKKLQAPDQLAPRHAALAASLGG